MSPLHGGVDRNNMVLLEGNGTDRRPFTGAWIETQSPQPSRKQRKSPLHGGVDRNDPTATQCTKLKKSPLHGGVDRNDHIVRAVTVIASRPFTGAWIETYNRRVKGAKHSSPLHGGVDRNEIT